MPNNTTVGDLWPAVKEAAIDDFGLDSRSIVKFALLFPEDGKLVAGHDCMDMAGEEVSGED